jgi:ferrous iron transport protein A
MLMPMSQTLPTSVPRLRPQRTCEAMPLARLRRGQQARVVGVREAGSLGERLMEMGLTPGTLVCIVRTGLLGDPMQLELRGYMLSLRRAQARQIDVTPLP